MSSRPRQTAADYAMIGVSPALIMVLIGSLIFFLVQVFYQGEYPQRLVWVLAMYVMGTVGLARISIEEGSSRAALFAVPLGFVVFIALSTFVQIEGALGPVSMPINVALMVLIWWSAHKLTWDCTVIDDSQDASGQGLWQQVEGDLAAATSNEPVETDAAVPVGTIAEAAEPDVPWLWRLFQPDKRKHSPGLWVIYFSMAALPMFGIGNLMLRNPSLETRRYVFGLLVTYVASGLGLLVTTSLLGLRRYLRQRRLEMPIEMTARWLTWGAALIVALILGAMLLPRRNPEYSVAQIPLPVQFTSPKRNASRVAVGPEGAKGKSSAAAKGKQPGDQPASSGEPGKASEPGGTKPGKGPAREKGGDPKGEGKGEQRGSKGAEGEKGKGEKGKGEGEKGPGKEPGSEKQGERKQGEKSTTGEKEKNGEKNGEKSPPPASSAASSAGQPTTPPASSPPPPPPPPPAPTNFSFNPLAWVVPGLQVLFYVTLALACAYFAWQYRAEIAAAWAKLMAELAALWAWLTGQKQVPAATATSTSTAATAPAPPPAKRFAEFTDPFASGAAAGTPLPQLIRYTFAALEAWGRDQGYPRPPGQTPLEYAEQLGNRFPAMAREVRLAVDLYSQLAYAANSLTSGTVDSLKSLWLRLRGN